MPLQRAHAEPMEERLLHAADAFGLLDGGSGATLPGAALLSAPARLAADEANSQAATQTRTQTETQATARHEIAFVDASLPELDLLLAGLQAPPGGTLDIVLVQPDEDGFARISATLAAQQDLSAIHLISHGQDGQVQLGRERLDAASLLRRAGEVAAWGQALAPEADWLIYGCDVAASPTGLALLHDLAALTGADVAASDDPTGAASGGGDWVLEQRTGPVETAMALSAAATQAWSGTLGSNEVAVNSTVTDEQTLSSFNRSSAHSVAVDGQGNYVVVWNSTAQDGSGKGVYARRFSANGTALTGEIQVSSNTAGDQSMANVASDAAGNFVVTWVDASLNDGDVMVRRFAANGAPLSAAQRASVVSAGGQTAPTVTMDPASGGYIVAWQGAGTGGQAGVYLRRFNSQDQAQGSTDTTVHSVAATALDLLGILVTPTPASDIPHDVSLAVDTTGRAVVTYVKSGQVYFQRQTPSDTVMGAILASFNNVESPDVAMDANGNFVIAFRASSPAAGLYLVSLAADGSVRGWASLAQGEYYAPSLAMLADGRFVVSYHSAVGGQPVNSEVYLRQYNADLNPAGAATQVNTYTSGQQNGSSVAMRSLSEMAVVWMGSRAGDPMGVSMRVTFDDTPVITSSAAVSVPENSSTALFVQATDLSLPAQTLRYQIYGGNDNGRFSINPDTGELTFVTPPNYEQPADHDADNVYELVVGVSDGGLSAQQDLRITVTNVYEPPLAVDDNTNAQSGLTIAVPVLANDQRSDSTHISLLDVGSPAHGTASLSGNDVLYTASAGYTGLDSLRYLVDDGLDGLSHYWRLEGDAQDAVGTAHGHLLNNPGTTTGPWGQALALDGQNQAVQLPGVSYGASGSTLSLWFRVDNQNLGSGYQTLYAHGSVGAADSLVVYLVESGATTQDGKSNVLRTRLRDVDDADLMAALDIPATGLADGQWHQYTLTTTAGVGARVYIDGQLMASSTTGGQALSPSGPVMLGGTVDLASTSFLHGALDAVSLRTRPLSAAEVLAQYNGTADPIGVVTVSVSLPAALPPISQADAYTLNEDSSLAITVASGWFDTAWSTRQRISFNLGSGGAADDVVVPITLTPATVSAALMQSNGADLRFVGDDGSLLAYSIERFNADGSALIWVRLPRITTSGAGSGAWLYYGNATATDAQSPSAVWSGMPVVLGMESTLVNRAAGAGAVTESGTTTAAGKLGDARQFNGTGSWVNLGSNAAVDNLFNGGGTLSAWIRPTGWGEGGYGRIASKADSTFSSGTGNGWSLELSETNRSLMFEIGFSGSVGRWRTADNSISLNTWQHVVVVYSNAVGSVPAVYINGVAMVLTQVMTPTGSASSDAALNLRIGNQANTTDRSFAGLIDQVMAWDGSRSAAQVAADYRAQAGTLATLGAVQTAHPGVLNNDRSQDSNTLSAQLVVGPAHAASFQFNADGSFSYTPLADYNGSDSFSYVALAGNATGAVTQVTLTITPVPDAPVITSNGGGATALLGVPENTQLVTTVTAHDADGTQPTFSLAGPDAALFSLNPSTGLLRFNAAPDYENPADANRDNVYELVVTASDGSLSDTQTLRVSVTPVNEAPLLQAALADQSVRRDQAFAYTVPVGSFADPDAGDTLVYTATLAGNAPLPAWLSFDPQTLRFSSTPGTADVGQLSLRVTATDSGGLSTTGAFTLTVLEPNSPPRITSNGGGATAVITVPENTTAVTTVQATDTDLPAQVLSFSISGTDATRFSIDAATGVLRFNQAPDYEQPTDANGDRVYELVVAVSDGEGGLATQNLLVNVLDMGGTLTVTTEADLADGDTSSPEALISNPGADGRISLREALLAANQSADLQRIEFAIPGAGSHTIVLGAALPKITAPVAIDGYTQAGASPNTLDNTLETGSNAVLMIGLQAPAAGAIEGLVFANGSSGSTLRGLSIAGFNNLGNSQAAVALESDNNTVAGNFIGLGVDGSTVLGNNTGIVLRNGADDNLIGGTSPADRNVVGGSSYAGIAMWGLGTRSNRVLGNLIGYTANAASAPGNGRFGVAIWEQADSNQIGGANPGEGNRIAQQRIGVLVDDLSLFNTIRGNAISASTGLGIDLNNDGVTANDRRDSDVGPNGLMNFPELDSAVSQMSQVQVGGSFNGAVNADVLLDFYASPGANASGHGEGLRYLGSLSVRTDAQGTVRFLASFAGITLPSGWQVSATATSSVGNTSEFSAVRAVVQFNNAPVFTQPTAPATGPASLDLLEGDRTLQIQATDADGHTLHYDIVGGADAARFIIDTETGLLSLIDTPDFEAPADADGDNVYQLTLRVGDGLANTDLALNVRIRNRNEAPALNRPFSDAQALQNQPWLLTLPADQFADPDHNEPLSLSASLADGSALPAWLRFDPATRQFSGTPAQADAGVLLTLRVTATDAAGAQAQGTFQLTVVDVNDAPVIVSDGGGPVASLSVPENSSVVTTVRATDADGPGQVLSYRIVGGPDALRFQLDPATGVLRFINPPDADRPGDADGDNVYELQVAASDGDLAALQTLRIQVSAYNDEAPRFSLPAGLLPDGSLPLAEGQQAVVTLQATDADQPAQTLGYRIAGGADAALFELDATTGALRFLRAPDFEAPADADGDNLYELELLVDDGQWQDRLTLRVRVTPLNDEAPRFITPAGLSADGSLSVAEGQQAVVTLQATDADLPAQTLGYRIAGGADAALFELDATTGALRFLRAPDFEAPADADGDNLYELELLVDDGQWQDRLSLRVRVTPLNDEAPRFIAPAGLSADGSLPVAEGQQAVVTLQATDADQPAQTLSYRIAGGADAALFELDAATGALRFLRAPDFEAPADADGDNLYELELLVDDGQWQGHLNLRVRVQAVNEAPLGRDATLNVPADGRLTLNRGHFGFQDAPGETGQLAAVRLQLPDAGQLWLNGVALAAETEVSAALIDQGALVWVAPADFRRSPAALLRFQVRDDGGTALGGQDLDPQARTLRLDLSALNRTPQAQDDHAAQLPALQGQADQPLQIATSLLLANDTDADGDTLSLSAVGDAVGGQVQWNGGSLVFIPATGTDAQAGQQPGFSYTVSDGHGGQTSARVWLSLTPPPAPPPPPPAAAPEPEPALAPAAPAAEARRDTVPSAPEVVPEAVEAPTQRVAEAAPAVEAPPLAEEPLPVVELPGMSAALGARQVGVAAPPAPVLRNDLAKPVASPLQALLGVLPGADGLMPQNLQTQDMLRLHTLSQRQALTQSWEQVRQQIQGGGEVGQHEVTLASTTVVSTGLSIGYVVWLLRSGVLLSSVLSALPAWQFLDPLPVLARSGAGGDADDDEAADDVERLFERDQPADAAAPAPAAPPTPAATASHAPAAGAHR